jgi:hypothetical protein
VIDSDFTIASASLVGIRIGAACCAGQSLPRQHFADECLIHC